MNPDCFAIIVAGGIGLRMNKPIPKQFLNINNKPIICYTLEAFLSCLLPQNIVLVLPKTHFNHWEEIKKQNSTFEKIQLAENGEKRFHSVLNGLNKIAGNGLVAIHDGVRPCISKELILSSFLEARKYNNAILCVTLKDSIRLVEGSNSKSVKRENYRIIQTPQTFDIQKLKKAYQQPYQDIFTDDASVYETLGEKIHLIEGDHKNIKITTEEDLKWVEKHLI